MGIVVVSRMGAAARTADDLSVTFLEDALDVGAIVSKGDREAFERLRGVLYSQETRTGCYWFEDEADSDEARELGRVFEDALPEGVRVEWEDGYTIIIPD